MLARKCEFSRLSIKRALSIGIKFARTYIGAARLRGTASTYTVQEFIAVDERVKNLTNGTTSPPPGDWWRKINKAARPGFARNIGRKRAPLRKTYGKINRSREECIQLNAKGGSWSREGPRICGIHVRIRYLPNWTQIPRLPTSFRNGGTGAAGRASKQSWNFIFDADVCGSDRSRSGPWLFQVRLWWIRNPRARARGRASLAAKTN